MQISFQLLALLAGFQLLSGCAEIRKLNPTRDVYQNIEGTFIDQVEKKVWSSNIDNFPNGVNIIRTNFQGVVRQKTMVSYLESICRRLLEHSPVSKVPFQITLTASQGYGEALATPDGFIAVPLGFLKSVESEDEIAWLLAHELAHIILRHHDIEWVEQYHEKTVTAAEQTLSAINLSNQIRSNFDIAADKELTLAAEKALAINSLLSLLSR
jgi:predicted Zn-dependent protease